MNIMSATYFANYNDYDGFDEVPCEVDTDTMEVVRFLAPVSCRWDEEGLMCVAETIQLSDGRDFEAIKTDEYEDAVDGGYAEDYNRTNIILFDNDMLEAVCTGTPISIA